MWSENDKKETAFRVGIFSVFLQKYKNLCINNNWFFYRNTETGVMSGFIVLKNIYIKNKTPSFRSIHNLIVNTTFYIRSTSVWYN